MELEAQVGDLIDMQDEIVARLASALNAQLVAAEARRPEQTLTPNSMDLYFQGQAWLNKGRTPDNVGQARGFFDRALSADPNNVEALIGSAWADTVQGVHLFVTDCLSAFAAAEAKLTKALSSVPDHAFGHGLSRFVDILTKRAAITARAPFARKFANVIGGQRSYSFSPHLNGRLVVAQSDVNRVTQEAIGGPGQIGDLANQLRLDPMHARKNKRRAEGCLSRRRHAQRRCLAG